MPSRQLRKLRQQQALQNVQDLTRMESDDSDNGEPDVAQRRSNAFAGFAALGGDDDGDKFDADRDEDADVDETQDANKADNSEAEAARPKKKKSSQKKKKKRKGKALEAQAGANDLDEIDRALHELGIAKPSSPPPCRRATKPPSTPSSHTPSRLTELLRINLDNLKVMNEMRKVFGKDVIVAAQADDDAQANDPNRSGALDRPTQVDLETFLKAPAGKGLSDIIARRNPFIDGKSTWLRASSAGLTMQMIQDRGIVGLTEFTFTHDKQYDSLEQKFFSLVQLHEPMLLVYFLHDHPYHVSSLIQISKLAKQDQNAALAADLCERALFTFGRTSSALFKKKLEEGRAAVDFARPENRQFWLAGWHYIKTLIRKGTYKTAFEWTKLFFSLDRVNDPYAMINWLHILAIRAHQARWFVDLCETELFAAAKYDASTYCRQTVALAKLQLNDTAGAKAAVIEGIGRVPWLYGALCSAVNLDCPKALWGIQARDADEALFTQLYIHMTRDLWSRPDATALLLEAAQAAEKPKLESLPRPPQVQLATARFIYLEDVPPLMGLVPRGMLHTTPNFDFDPIPPSRGDNIFSSKAQELPWRPAHQTRADEAGLSDNLTERAGPVIELPGHNTSPGEARGMLTRVLHMFASRARLVEGDSSEPTGANVMPGSWQDDREDVPASADTSAEGATPHFRAPALPENVDLEIEYLANAYLSHYPETAGSLWYAHEDIDDDGFEAEVHDEVDDFFGGIDPDSYYDEDELDDEDDGMPIFGARPPHVGNTMWEGVEELDDNVDADAFENEGEEDEEGDDEGEDDGLPTFGTCPCPVGNNTGEGVEELDDDIDEDAFENGGEENEHDEHDEQHEDPLYSMFSVSANHLWARIEQGGDNTEAWQDEFEDEGEQHGQLEDYGDHGDSDDRGGYNDHGGYDDHRVYDDYGGYDDGEYGDCDDYGDYGDY